MKTGITKPEEHDWTGERCTFMVALGGGGAPVVDAETGLLVPGPVKAKGEVIGQRYLGRAGEGLIPDFEIEVRTKSGDYRINLLKNRFQVVEG